MKRCKRTKSSYFSVLLRCFGAYTLFLVIAAIALLFWALMESSTTVISLSERDLSEYNDILQAEETVDEARKVIEDTGDFIDPADFI